MLVQVTTPGFTTDKTLHRWVRDEEYTDLIPGFSIYPTALVVADSGVEESYGRSQRQEGHIFEKPDDSTKVVMYSSAWNYGPNGEAEHFPDTNDWITAIVRHTADKATPYTWGSETVILDAASAGFPWIRLGTALSPAMTGAGWVFYISTDSGGIYRGTSANGTTMDGALTLVLSQAGQGVAHAFVPVLARVHIEEDGSYVMLYLNNVVGPGSAYYSATSADGITWVKGGASPVFITEAYTPYAGGMEAGNLTRIGDKLVSLFEGNSGEFGDYRWSICAIHADAIEGPWTAYPSSLVVYDEASAFAKEHVATPTTNKIPGFLGGQRFCVIQGSNTFDNVGGWSRWDIGIATMS